MTRIGSFFANFLTFKSILMKLQNTFFAFLLFIPPLSIWGQTASLGGNIYATLFKNERENNFSTTKDNNLNVFLTPSYSVFLTSKLMVGAGITVGGFHNQNKVSDFLHNDFKSVSGAIAPRVRYYFLDKSKLRPFAAFQFEYSGSKTTSVFTNVSSVIESKSTASAWNYVPAIGVNYFFSDDVALELSLQHSQTFLKFTNGKNDFNQSSLNLGFQNFLTLKPNPKTKKKGKEAPPQYSQYLHANKWLVGGNATLWRFSQGTHLSKNFTLTLNPEIGYFLTKNIVLGTGSYLNKAKNNPANWAAVPFLRFYQPIFPCFSVFAEGKASFYNVTTNDLRGNEVKYIQDQYNLGLGFNYFLSQRVAVEGSLYNYSYLKQKEVFLETITNHEFGVQARIRYFLN